MTKLETSEITANTQPLCRVCGSHPTSDARCSCGASPRRQREGRGCAACSAGKAHSRLCEPWCSCKVAKDLPNEKPTTSEIMSPAHDNDPNSEMSFSGSLADMRHGRKVRRYDWHPGRWVRMAETCFVDECPELGAQREYRPTFADLTALDWSIHRKVGQGPL